MRLEEGAGLIARKPQDDLTALTRLMQLSRHVAETAEALYGTEEAARGMDLMEIADGITNEVGVWAERCGYTLDEVTRPLWEGTLPTTQ
jgi:hypothetical protein